MPEPITTALLLAAAAAGAYLLLSEDEALAAQPSFDDSALGEFTEIRDGVRVFKSDVAKKILTMLTTQGVEPVEVQGSLPPGVLLSVVPAKGAGSVNAKYTVDESLGFGLVVLGSLSLVLPTKEPKLLLIVTKDKRTTASPTSKFAVLAEETMATTGVPMPSSPPFDAGMPSDVVEMINAALSDPNLSPEACEAMAGELEKAGYPSGARALRDRAKAIRLKRRLDDEKAGGTPFTIRATKQGNAADLPWNTAKHYTGDGNRWREIVPVNSQLGMIVKDTKVGAFPDPWRAGLTILLPLAWEARGKPLPKPLGEGKKKKTEPASEEIIGPPNPYDPDWNKPRNGKSISSITLPQDETVEERNA